jgi:hypothetical protein
MRLYSYVQLIKDNITFPKVRSYVYVVTLTVAEHLFSCVKYKMLICHQTRSKFANGPNRMRGSLPFHPKTQMDPVPETCCYCYTTGFLIPTAKARVRYQALSCGTGLGQSSIRTVFL